MGAWILEEACRQLAHLQAFDPGLRMSVNLSVRQLESEEVVEHVRRAFEGAGVTPGSLTLEITESLLLSETAPVIERIHDLAALGVKFAIDDFGTGFSSLAYLQRLPIASVKIDRAFVKGRDEAGSSAALVGTIIRMSEALALDTLAEGVETSGQLEVLRGMGCRLAQDYLFARPLDADAATDYSRASTGTPLHEPTGRRSERVGA